MGEQVVIKPIDEIRTAMVNMEDQFKMALPDHIPPEKFVRVIMTAVNQEPRLQQADRRSLYGAAMKCAQDGLLPDGREAALVTFGKTVQYMPMLSGILKKIRNSGELGSISAHCVYENDEFNYWVDEHGEHIKHTPTFSDGGAPLLYYARASTKDGAAYIELMTIKQIDKVRAVSKAKSGGPWTSWFEEMAKKTVLRRLSKRLPMSSDLEMVIQRDDELYDLNSTPDEKPKPQTTQPSRLENIIEGGQASVAETVAQDPAKELEQPAVQKQPAIELQHLDDELSKLNNKAEEPAKETQGPIESPI